MRIFGIFCLLFILNGCSFLLFYLEFGLLFMLQKVHLAYRDVTLITVDGVKLYVWWLLAKLGVLLKGMVLHLYGNGGNLVWHLGGSWWLLE